MPLDVQRQREAKIFSYPWPKIGWLLCLLEYYSGPQNEDLAVINLPGDTFCGKLGRETPVPRGSAVPLNVSTRTVASQK